MKSYNIVFLFHVCLIVASPLMVICSPVSNSNASTKSTPTTAKPRLDQPELNRSPHRIPGFKNGKAIVEDIWDYEAHIDIQEGHTPNQTTNMNVPIPRGCPNVTGTPVLKGVLWNLNENARYKASQRGCRLFIMLEIIDETAMYDYWTQLTLEQQINHSLVMCYLHCGEAYGNGTELNALCAEGCLKTFNTRGPWLVVPKTHNINNNTLEDNSQTNKTNLELLDPTNCPTITGTTYEELKKDGLLTWQKYLKPMAAQRGCRFFIMHEQIEAKQKLNRGALFTEDLLMNQTLSKCHSSCVQAYDNEIELNDSCAQGCTKTSKATKAAIDSLGEVLDDSKLSELEGEQNAKRSTIKPLQSTKPSLLKKVDDAQSKIDSFNSGSHKQRHNGHKTGDQDNYYRTSFCYYLSRLFYLTALILFLYAIYWLLRAVHQTFLEDRTSSIRRANGVATATGVNVKWHKFLYTKSKKYFKLSNKSNSNTSLQSSYQSGDDNGSCAVPLTVKQPILDGELEVNPSESNTDADK